MEPNSVQVLPAAQNIEVQTFQDSSMSVRDKALYTARIGPLASVHSKLQLTNVGTQSIGVNMSISQGNTLDPRIYISLPMQITTTTTSATAVPNAGLNASVLDQIVVIQNNWLANSVSSTTVTINGDIIVTPSKGIYEFMSRYVSLADPSDADDALSLAPSVSFDRNLFSHIATCAGSEAVGASFENRGITNPFRTFMDSELPCTSRQQNIAGVSVTLSGGTSPNATTCQIFTSLVGYSCIPSSLFDYFNTGRFDPFIGVSTLNINMAMSPDFAEGSSVIMLNRALFFPASAQATVSVTSTLGVNGIISSPSAPYIIYKETKCNPVAGLLTRQIRPYYLYKVQPTGTNIVYPSSTATANAFGLSPVFTGEINVPQQAFNPVPEALYLGVCRSSKMTGTGTSLLDRITMSFAFFPATWTIQLNGTDVMLRGSSSVLEDQYRIALSNGVRVSAQEYRGWINRYTGSTLSNIATSGASQKPLNSAPLLLITNKDFVVSSSGGMGAGVIQNLTATITANTYVPLVSGGTVFTNNSSTNINQIDTQVYMVQVLSAYAEISYQACASKISWLTPAAYFVSPDNSGPSSFTTDNRIYGGSSSDMETQSFVRGIKDVLSNNMQGRGMMGMQSGMGMQRGMGISPVHTPLNNNKQGGRQTSGAQIRAGCM